MSRRYSETYQRIQKMIADNECVVLDGGVATELQRVGMKDERLSDSDLWGTMALYHAPQAVLEVHRRYVGAGCDVISTNTWALLSAPEMEKQAMVGRGKPTHWMDAARLAMQLARQAVKESDRAGKCAIAFSINGDIANPERQATLKLLTRIFDEDPPDIILLETLTLIRDNLTFPAVEQMVATGLPVWLSFRRCRHGVCGVHGQHWGGPEGDQFGRAARRFEEAGVGALMINCLPVSHVTGMLPWLRDFTDLPLGVYANLGRYADPGWKFDDQTGPKEYADLALQWRSEGAQIIGGCCGVTPEHLAGLHDKLAGTKPGRPRVSAAPVTPPEDDQDAPIKLPAVMHSWKDERGRGVYPLPFPELRLDPGVFEPTEGSFLVWKYLFRSGIGQGKRCLDIGCGSGILTIQLALNGATSIHAIDIQREAAANTLANSFRNGVEKRVTASVEDLYTFSPGENYDLIVASLYQMPVDPYGQISGHRPVDFWGRNLVDHLISILPQLLAPEGKAYIMQLSILGQLRTSELLDDLGFEATVVDFTTFNFGPVFRENIEQIHRVEKLSDAYHLTLGRNEVMVSYLLEAKRKA